MFFHGELGSLVRFDVNYLAFQPENRKRFLRRMVYKRILLSLMHS